MTQTHSAEAGDETTLREACKPWEFHVGEPPDDGSPLLAVYDAGLTYAFDLLAKDLGVKSYQPCDGTETWEGDVAGTLHNILVAGGIICDETGARAVLPALSSRTPARAAGDPVGVEAAAEALHTHLNFTSPYTWAEIAASKPETAAHFRGIARVAILAAWPVAEGDAGETR